MNKFILEMSNGKTFEFNTEQEFDEFVKYVAKTVEDNAIFVGISKDLYVRSTEIIAISKA